MAHVPSVLNKFILHPVQGAAAVLLFGLLRILPLSWASAVMGRAARLLGPKLRVSVRARRNLRHAFPEKSEAEREIIVHDMWENLGRVVGEFPHVNSIKIYDPDGPVTEVIGLEHLDAIVAEGGPGILYSGHIGNWEILSLGATQRGVPLDRIYREANNRLVNWLYERGRSAIDGALIKKGPDGVRDLIAIFKNKRYLALLADQKLNDGIPVPFFGRDAMTAPALAEMALRYDCPVVAARVKRLKGARFQIEVLPPVRFTSTGDKKADVLAAMTQVNAQLEAFIRDTPGQWFWLHNRWPAESP